MLDEKSFRRGQNYITVLSDFDGRRVLDVVEGREQASVDKLWAMFDEPQRKAIQPVCMDMWQAFENSVRARLESALIIYDRFHVSKKANEAVDQVRRAEHKELSGGGDNRLKGTKYLWLRSGVLPEPGEDTTLWTAGALERAEAFAALVESRLKTSGAWAMKEVLSKMWERTTRAEAAAFFEMWHGWVSGSALTPMRKVASMLRHRLEGVLNGFDQPMSNGPAEGFNSKIQLLKSAAHSDRNFENYRTRILFFCGRLTLRPAGL